LGLVTVVVNRLVLLLLRKGQQVVNQ
jgi:hypothetical protein